MAALVIAGLIGAVYDLDSLPLPKGPTGGACQSDNDCHNLDCKGVGPWYCDRDGFPICGTDKVCACGLACM
jgi:hypothetical protein